MPAKSGFSHAFAAFTSIIIGSLLSNYLAAHESVLTEVTRTAGRFLTTTIGVPTSSTVGGMLLVSSILAFAWGVAYHVARH
jgi:hypothetical protein